MQKMIGGFRVAHMISVAAKLRIADHLAAGTKTIKDLAHATGCHEDSLHRLLRALAAVGIFEEEEGPKFNLTPRAELLRSDVTGSLRISAEVVGEEWMWRPWGFLAHSVTTGETAFDRAYGSNTWDWFAENLSAGRLFDGFMDEITVADAPAIVGAYNFAGAGTIVDIAGGRGVLLAEILRRNGSTRGVLFNLPQVIEAARLLLDNEIAERINFVSGNFFQNVPVGGDLYILKNILHDWNDEAVCAILATCRRSLSADAKLLIIEHIIESANEGGAGKTGDIQMMVRNGGRNRTEEEFRKLLKRVGFRLSGLNRTSSGPALLEAST
jgi:hypothetical protein